MKTQTVVDKFNRGYVGRTNEEIKLIIEAKTFRELTLSDILLYEALASPRKPEQNRYRE